MNEELDGRRTGLDESQAYDIDALAELSAEDIESLLAEGAGVAPRKPAERPPQGDVLEMLDDKEEDDDLWDIQDMLKKSDRNEAISTEGVDDEDPEENPVERLLADIEGTQVEAPLDPRAKRAQEKQHRAEEKARLKEEKAAKRDAAREEKAAKRELKKQKKNKKAGSGQPQEKDSKNAKEYDLLADRDLLDSIVSDAGNLGREEMENAPRGYSGFGMNELGEEYDAARERRAASEPVRGERLDSMMGNSAESGIMEIDMDDIDAFIPDIGEASKGGKKPKGKLFAKLVTMLMEEEEEPENENLSISKENQDIIRELDGEKGKGKGKGKKGKAAKKEKKPAKKAAKKEKPKKEPKPKKEKVREPEPPGKKITFKKALPVLLLGASVGAVVFIFVNISTDYSVKRAAEAAFKEGDYTTCYRNLYGKKLSEAQAQMLGKSESILYMEQQSRRYDLFLKDGSERKALDSLFQTVGEYPQIYAKAAEYGAEPEVQGIYAGILNVLLEKYGVSEADAQRIAAIESRIKYTRAVDFLVQGKGTGSAGTPEESPAASEEGAESLPDQLPEESELGEGNFSDN